MKPCSPELKAQAESMARQFPEVAKLISDWRKDELEILPFSRNESLDVLRGRVQALTELQRFLGLD